MKFKKDAEIFTSDFWYDLIDGGYISPEKVLDNDEDIDKINNAIETLLEFKSEAESEGVLEYM